MRSVVSTFVVAAIAAWLPRALPAQGVALSVDRVFRQGEFRSAPLPDVHWLADGHSYLETQPAADRGGGVDIVRVDATTGQRTVIAPAAALTVGGKRLDVEDIVLSSDERKALLFHSSVRVWRTNTRGVYHVLDFATRRLVPIATITTPSGQPSRLTDTVPQPMLGQNPRLPSFLGRGLASGAADPNLQMFAKFSPDGRMVAYVRGNDLWVTDLATGRAERLTTDGSDDIINGTSDWVYEEELGLRDAFRWSPDSKRIAYWRFDQSPVPAFPMENDLTTYPVVSVLRYPKAGAPNSRVRIGVVDLAARRTTWMNVGPDTGVYLARADWLGPDSLVIQRLPRRQTRVDVLVRSARTGDGRTLLTERDSAYVDVEGGALEWVNDGHQFLWLSDRSGWRQVYLYDRAGSLIRQVTRDGMDVLSIDGVDEARGDVYVTAAAPDPTQRQLFRFALDGTRPGAQVTQRRGTHAVTIAPGAHYLVDFFSTAATPTTATLFDLPGFTERRVLEDNRDLAARLAAAGLRAPEFFRVPLPNGVELDAMRIVPASFDSSRKYPVLMYVYGGPASPTVNDAWGGTRYLWHQILAQHGYVVVTVDNRGAAWRGRAFRKVTQLHLGRVESQDQIDAARWLARQPWVDPSRIGIWGWSYGGYMTTLTAARGGDVFKAAIAVAPVTDWRLYDTIYTERYMWTPQENAAGYDEASPQRYVDGLKASLLLVHGTGDDNVHPQNTIQLADRLEAAGKPFLMMLYPNRTHAIAGGNTQAHLFDTLTRFVLEKL